jgi:hypothetical protein
MACRTNPAAALNARNRIVNSLLNTTLQPARQALLTVGEFQLIYNPRIGTNQPWCINDHCFIQAEDGLWHMFGITHVEPFNWDDDPARNLAHATACHLLQTPWDRQSHAVVADEARYGEVHMWAPHVVRHAGRYYMFVCVGARNHSRYRINLLTSRDLIHWERHPANPLVVDGWDARDPNVQRIGDEWVMYYTATSEPRGGNHIVACRTSPDLIHWGERRVVYVDQETGTFGGPTESPFVVQRGDCYYLFICNNDRRDGYDATDVYLSGNPFCWTMADRVATVPAHAAEVLQDVDGQWYISHCGWFRGGLYLAPLQWQDGN